MAVPKIDGDIVLDPPRSQWKPEGIRLASSEELKGGPLPRRDRFTTFHATTRCDDTVGGTVLAPVFGETFTVEERAYVAEGPTFLSDDTILFTPLIPSMEDDSTTNHLLIALDGENGERLWTIDPAQNGQGGAPLVLLDPETGREVVYAAGVETVVAVDGMTGNRLWETQTGLTNDFANHCFGISYHPQTDSVLVLYLTGFIQAYDRATGEQNDSLSFVEEYGSAPMASLESTDVDLDLETIWETFDVDNNEQTFENILRVLAGVGVVIANYFSCDPDSGNIFMIASLEDGHDGDTRPGDGSSEASALHILEMTTDGKEFRLKCASSPIPGGSATTPTISADGKRIYTADNSDAFIAFDTDCNVLYTVNTGFPVLASFSTTPNNGEIFVPTRNGVLKIVESEDRNGAQIDEEFVTNSRSSLTQVFQRSPSRKKDGGRRSDITSAAKEDDRGPEVINASITTSAENAIAVIACLGIQLEEDNPLAFIPIEYALVQLDRKTGELMSSATLREETVASLSPDSNGVMVLGNSPARRLFFAASQKNAMTVLDVYKPLTGGITKYGMAGQRYDLIVRDASCAAASRLDNLLNYQDDESVDADILDLSKQTDLVDIRNLIEQAQRSLDKNWVRGVRRKRSIGTDLDSAQSNVDDGRFEDAMETLSALCESF